MGRRISGNETLISLHSTHHFTQHITSLNTSLHSTHHFTQHITSLSTSLHSTYHFTQHNIVIFYYPQKHNNIIQQYININLHSWQHVSAANSHHQAKTEQSVGTLKVCIVWDHISFTGVLISPSPVLEGNKLQRQKF